MLLLVVVPLLGAGSGAFADDPGSVDVVVVSGSLDGRLIEFVMDAIENSGAGVVVLQLDSAATLDDGIEDLIALVASPPVPVAVYAGPAPATVSGGALRLLAAAEVSGAAPGVILGPAAPDRKSVV